MIDKEDLNKVLHFVSKRWMGMSRDPQNKAIESLPTNFWMNSIGGEAGNVGWVTTLMYTEDKSKLNPSKKFCYGGDQNMQSSSDIIQINKK